MKSTLKCVYAHSSLKCLIYLYYIGMFNIIIIIILLFSIRMSASNKLA